MPFWRTTSADGTSRRWTLREMVQGKPIGHPTHAMLVHFPIALTFGAVGFDVTSRLGAFPEAPIAATWLLLAGLTLTVPTAITGLVDWAGMVPGSSKRIVATKHLIAQSAAAAMFALDLGIRWGDRSVAQASAAWIALGSAGVVASSVGQWLGGELVFAMGMRVSTRRKSPTR